MDRSRQHRRRRAVAWAALPVMVMGGIAAAVVVSDPPSREPAAGVRAEGTAAAPDPSAPGERGAPAPAEVADVAELEPGDEVAAEDFWRATDTEPEQPLRRQTGARDRISIPALDASLELVSAPTRSGILAVPGGVEAAGWSTSTVRPGAEHGVSLIAAHRDTQGGGRGIKSPFFDAEALDRGATVRVTLDGRTTTYRVTRIDRVGPDDVPASVLDRSGPHRIALVTCGGKLKVGRDGVLRWSERVIVWARATGR